MTPAWAGLRFFFFKNTLSFLCFSLRSSSVWRHGVFFLRLRRKVRSRDMDTFRMTTPCAVTQTSSPSNMRLELIWNVRRALEVAKEVVDQARGRRVGNHKGLPILRSRGLIHAAPVTPYRAMRPVASRQQSSQGYQP